MEKLLLGIDIGTSACKVAVFDKKGNVLAQSSQSYNLYYPNPGWVEQNPDEWYESICTSIKDALQKGNINPSNIVGIGIDGQSWSAIPVDKDGNCLHNTPIWMDTRARHISTKVTKELGFDTIFQIAGNAFEPAYTTPKILWFKENLPDIYEKTYKFLQSNSYIALKLTGTFTQDKSQGYGLHFFDAKTCSYNASLANALGISLDKVPDIYDCHSVIGSVTKKAASQTGLMEGTPVVAGGLDAACGTLGAGVYKAGQTQEQGGQAGGMSICLEEALAHPKLILSPHVIPDLWLLQGGSVGGGGVLKWFKQEFAKTSSFDELTELASQVPAGSDGVIFLPYMAGERSPIWDPDAKGVYYGLGFDKTKGHMIRASMEGVAYSLEHNLQTAKEVGVEIQELIAMGGAANSLLWTQIKSDVTGKVIKVPTSDTATTLGAAILAGVGVGIYEGFEEAVKETIVMTRSHTPNMENHKAYQAMMEIYLELYQNLKDTFKKGK
ncbi:xylulokinase [Candidatus Galacturonibacter soehngenii]|uniref:FGGY-family carbohydrate kinase n=1 Tax=Candidatus Galacturonatibacter soehngenii TaxID=2307010 RepID=A0A7V7QI55_9FIRM|nr:FGGY-family carbohydrate kinase [Candidatus Galacturonibacter soehngenii]KAB1435808.1 FGGY-family carbohydrate kinase [Candidatus Galacturonibacter soehngenii]MBA4686550.1 FGGY-family carbohydrate kinase [Candidatus Galacturonibacter soehngenii]